MAELTLRPDLVERLESIAKREDRSVDDLLEMLLTRYAPDIPV